MSRNAVLRKAREKRIRQFLFGIGKFVRTFTNAANGIKKLLKRIEIQSKDLIWIVNVLEAHMSSVHSIGHFKSIERQEKKQTTYKESKLHQSNRKQRCPATEESELKKEKTFLSNISMEVQFDAEIAMSIESIIWDEILLRRNKKLTFWMNNCLFSPLNKVTGWILRYIFDTNLWCKKFWICVENIVIYSFSITSFVCPIVNSCCMLNPEGI